MFKTIDVDTWPRKEIFYFFRDFEDPFFNMTANVDVTRLYEVCKRKGYSFSLAALFCSQSALNTIPEFRMRLLDGRVVEYDQVHATQTILNDDETFSFCYFENKADIETFDAAGKAARDRYKKLKTFDVETDRIDMIYYSVIPWISFTSFKHASRLDNTKTVPRIVFGKTFNDSVSLKMPVSVEGHHSMMDGLHVGKFFNAFQDILNSLS